MYCLLAHLSPPLACEPREFICFVHWCFPGPRGMSSTQQSLNENMGKYELLLYVSIWKRFYGWALDFLLLLFLLHSMSKWAKNILLLTCLSTSPYDRVVIRNVISPSEIILKFIHSEILPFMKYHCDSILQLCWIQHEKFYIEKASQKIGLTVYYKKEFTTQHFLVYHVYHVDLVWACLISSRSQLPETEGHSHDG